jgi:hypothetical protein
MSDTGDVEQFSEAERLALVEQSPAAVAAHDKPAWLALFARYNLVEDPVGSSPHMGGIYDRRTGYRGRGSLSRFYDTFIAPNAVCFHVDCDSACGLHVMRDLTLEITMSPQIVVRVPMHLLYELTIEDGQLKVFRLAAHWELWPMLKQQMASGWPFAQVGVASAARMLRYLGVSGMAGFMRALSSVGDAGKERITRFSRYFNAADPVTLAGLFARPEMEIAFPHAGRRLSIAALAGEGGEMSFTKVLAAGNVVSATMNYRKDGSHFQGVALFELDRHSLKIVGLTFYWSRN